MRELYIIGECPARRSQDYLSALWMCVRVSIWEYRDTSTSRNMNVPGDTKRRAKYERSGRYEEKAARAQHLQQQLRIISSWGGPGPVIPKACCCCYEKVLWTETLPNVAAGRAELRTDNSAAMFDEASDRAKDAHSLPDRESSCTRVTIRILLLKFPVRLISR